MLLKDCRNIGIGVVAVCLYDPVTLRRLHAAIHNFAHEVALLLYIIEYL